MRTKPISALVLTVALLAGIVRAGEPNELTLDNLTLRFSAKGGALTSVKVGEVRYDLGERSFTDQLIRSTQEGVEEREELNSADYVLQDRYQKNGRQGISFMTESTGFPKVSIRKQYELFDEGPDKVLELFVVINNNGREPIELAHRARLILLPGEGKVTIYQPTDKGTIRPIAYPGEDAGNVASLLPKTRGYGVANEAGEGFVFIAPPRRASAFYSWLETNSRRLVSEEYFGPHWKIDAGKHESFILRLVFTRDVKGYLASHDLSSGSLRGKPCAHQRLFETPPRPLRTIDVGGLRQADCKTPRDKLVKGFHIPLDILKEVRASDVGYHTDWFSSNKPIDLLYLPQVGGNMIENGKNVLNELAARLPIRARTVPLIPEVLGVRGRKPYSVYDTYFGSALDPWTMEELGKLGDYRPQVVLVQKLDFKIAQPAFLDFLNRQAQAGAGLVFYECANVPTDVRGTVRNTTEELRLALLPRMNNQKGRLAEVWGDEARMARTILTTGPYRSQLLRNNPSVPQDRLNERGPVVWSREFPFHDYAFLTLAKAVRLVAGGVTPSATITRADAANMTLSVACAGRYTLKTVLKDTRRFTDGETTRTLDLVSGENTVPLTIPALPGGDHVAELRLVAPDGSVADAAAFHFNTPLEDPLSLEFAEPTRIFAADAPIAFRVTLPNGTKQNAQLVAELEDSDFRILRRETKDAGAAVDFSFPQALRPGLLQRVIVRLVSEGRTLTRVVEEVSVRDRPFDPTDTRAYITISPATPQSTPLLRELGFDYAITGFESAGVAETIRQCANLGMRAIPRGCADKSGWFRPYRDDNPRAPASRSTCFSSPAYQKELTDRIRKAAALNRYDFYNVRLQWLGDECFLGSTVCYSPTCLKDFRADLARRYGEIAKLNAEWRTNFAAFEDVTPCQLAELKGRDNLAPWLEHKMFMSRQFAEKWVDGTKRAFKDVVPGMICGPTGTPQPGYGWDWAQMMKYIDAIGYYGGAQRKLIHDFADFYGRPILAGQCGGGYTDAEPDYEPYNYNTMWSGLLKGSNLAYHYFGAAIDGDFVPTANMRYWATSMAELKSGIGKLWLSGHQDARVYVLYSQASLFAAMATIGKTAWQDSLSSWWRLLSDLKINFRFYSYEVLAEKGVPKECRVFVLPTTLALSSAERTALAAFKRRGGRVLADRTPGIYDGAGVRTEEKLDFVHVLGKELATYAAIDLGGAAGESASESRANGEKALRLRETVRTALEEARVRAEVAVTDEEGHEVACDAPLRMDGENFIFALHVDPMGAENEGRFHLDKAPRVTASLPKKGHVYDVRAKKYLGQTDRITTTLAPGYTRMYAILKARPEPVRLVGPELLRAGEKATFRFTAKGAKGPQVFHFEITDPSGRTPWAFRENRRVEGGAGEFIFESALTDQLGTWQARVTHVNTGSTETQSFKIFKE